MRLGQFAYISLLRNVSTAGQNCIVFRNTAQTLYLFICLQAVKRNRTRICHFCRNTRTSVSCKVWAECNMCHKSFEVTLTLSYDS